MNSSCFKYFATWIKTNNTHTTPHAIHFVLNKSFHWQEVSIHALRCFSASEITIEKVAGRRGMRPRYVCASIVALALLAGNASSADEAAAPATPPDLNARCRCSSSRTRASPSSSRSCARDLQNAVAAPRGALGARERPHRRLPRRRLLLRQRRRQRHPPRHRPPRLPRILRRPRLVGLHGRSAGADDQLARRRRHHRPVARGHLQPRRQRRQAVVHRQLAHAVSCSARIGSSLTVNGLVDFLPRNRNVSDPTGLYLGDYVDVKLAYVEYTVPTDRVDMRISVGKIDSTLGIEYRTAGVARSHHRHALAHLPLHLRPPDGRQGARRASSTISLVAALAVTNGSNVTEQFPFSDEIDTNNFKTVSGRVSTKLPVGAGLELGVSGAFGAQDFQFERQHLSVARRRRPAPRDPRLRYSRRVRLRQRRRTGPGHRHAAHPMRHRAVPALQGRLRAGRVSRAQLAHALRARRLARRVPSQRRELRLHHGSHARDRRAAARARHAASSSRPSTPTCASSAASRSSPTTCSRARWW